MPYYLVIKNQFFQVSRTGKKTQQVKQKKMSSHQETSYLITAELMTVYQSLVSTMQSLPGELISTVMIMTT